MVEKAHLFTEGVQERDLMEMVYCKAFRKFLKFECCTPENCKHHKGIEKDEAKQDGKVVHVQKWAICAYPEKTPLIIVCEA